MIGEIKSASKPVEEGGEEIPYTLLMLTCQIPCGPWRMYGTYQATEKKCQQEMDKAHKYLKLRKSAFHITPKLWFGPLGPSLSTMKELTEIL